MRYKLIAPLIILAFASCQKEKITIGKNVSETFYVDNNGESMRVLVEGNTESKAFLLFVHGGPGTSSFFYNTDYISNNIEDKYACVYYDQRNAGASQGNGGNLNLAQMTEDLKNVILVLKSRYGQSSSVFILGHSFGGLLTASFLTTEDNQSLVKGWLFVDGCHNYPLGDTLTRQKLLTYGQQQIDSNENVDQWNPIIAYCNEHTGNFTIDESNQLNSYAVEAENYFPIKQFDVGQLFKDYSINQDWPITSMVFNKLSSYDVDFENDLHTMEFTSSLFKVTIPTLILFGEYDFNCAKGLGDDVFNHISSIDKNIVISPIGGHNLFVQDESFFCTEIDTFIEQHK